MHVAKMASLLRQTLGVAPRTALSFAKTPAVLARTGLQAARHSSVPVPKNRVLSPHLRIYKFRSNMVSSVVFRGTGIAMMAGLSTLSILYIFGTHKYNYYVYQLQQYPIINGIVKFGVAFPLSYHFFGGLRHLAWDNVIGNNIQWNKQTALASMAAAGAISVASMFVESDE